MAEIRIAERYRKDREIGMGGMGVVYLGFDTVTGETVAIKELKPEMIKNDAEIVARFEREGEALRKLNHPSIVKVLATAEHQGLHYIVLEYVDGGSLRDRLDETPQLPINDILNIALDLSDALARAHRLQIVHRDIKPANVLIASDGTPRLTDFGVARFGDTTRITKTGVVVGTISYLSPEALNSEPLDERADLWAFGVMLYEMLTGVLPFDGETPGAILMKILRDPTPDILQYRNYHDLGSWGLPGLIYWLLEKEREKRPQSARLVGAILENLLSGKEMPMNWFGDETGMYDDTPLSLPPDTTAKALRDYTTSSLHLADLVSKNDALSGVDPAISMADSFSATELAIDTSPVAKNKPRRSRLKLVTGVVGLVLIAALLGVVALFMSWDTSPPTTTYIPVAVDESVATGTYVVVVAQPEYIDGNERDVQRFIADDLRFHLEQVPLSNVRITTYPDVVRSASEARQVAEQINAHLILWGNYDSDRVEINIQVGDLAMLPKLVFPQSELEELANARYHMVNERQETLAFAVLTAMNSMLTMSNETWGMILNLAIAERIDEPSATVQGNNLSAVFHRYLVTYTSDTAAGLPYLNDAIDLDPNAFLYIARALAYAKLGEIEASRQDVQTALQLSPGENWISPYMMLANDAIYFQNDLASAIPYMDEILSYVEDDWFYWGYRGTLNYLTGNNEAAASDIERSLALEPQSNFPYIPAIALALQDADFIQVQGLFEEVLEKFPDPRFIERILLVTYNEDVAESILSRYVSAFGNFSLKRWQAVVNDSQAIMDSGVHLGSDAYFLQGFAYCNLGDNAAAEVAYTAGIEVDPDLMVFYFLRAEVRRNQNNIIGAGQDAATIFGSEQAGVYQPLLTASLDGDLSCRNFLDTDLAAIYGIEAATEEATQEVPNASE